MNEEEFKALIAKIEKAMGEKMDTKLKESFKEVSPEVLKAISDNSVELNKNLEKSNEELIKTQKTQAGMIEELVSKLNDSRKGDTLSMKDNHR